MAVENRFHDEAQILKGMLSEVGCCQVADRADRGEVICEVAIHVLASQIDGCNRCKKWVAKFSSNEVVGLNEFIPI